MFTNISNNQNNIRGNEYEFKFDKFKFVNLGLENFKIKILIHKNLI